MRFTSTRLSGWGNCPQEVCFTHAPANRSELQEVVIASQQRTVIPRGLGRSYGDSALNQNSGVLLQSAFNRFLSFDPATGVLECEAGVSLGEIIECFLPRGWFLPTTPGTKFVTVGGAIAADVHGKNHHGVGSFGNFIQDLRLLLADGSEVLCSRVTRPQLFWATIGGMGLTGCILSARIKLTGVPSAYVSVNYHRTRNLEETFELFSDCDSQRQYSVAWVDCLARGVSLGRSVVMLADDARVDQLPPAIQQSPYRLPAKRPLRVPFFCPQFTINSSSVRLFNSLYYASHGDRTELVDFNTFFYPLDGIANWNRIYGRRGFVQYQAWLPRESSRAGLTELLAQVAESRKASFLAVLKSCGEADGAMLGYLQPGHTLALDFANEGDELRRLCDKLDRILLKFGGRVYLAKDALTNGDRFREMYPRLQEFLEVKAAVDPAGRFASSQSRRLKIA